MSVIIAVVEKGISLQELEECPEPWAQKAASIARATLARLKRDLGVVYCNKCRRGAVCLKGLCYDCRPHPDHCQCDLCRTDRAAVETVSRQCLEHGGVEYVPEPEVE